MVWNGQFSLSSKRRANRTLRWYSVSERTTRMCCCNQHSIAICRNEKPLQRSLRKFRFWRKCLWEHFLWSLRKTSRLRAKAKEKKGIFSLEYRTVLLRIRFCWFPEQTKIIANKPELEMILWDLNFHRNFLRPSAVTCTETSALRFRFICRWGFFPRTLFSFKFTWLWCWSGVRFVRLGGCLSERNGRYCLAMRGYRNPKIVCLSLVCYSG
jgi:hypothetical protein